MFISVISWFQSIAPVWNYETARTHIERLPSICLGGLLIPLFALQSFALGQNRAANLVVINAKVRTMTARGSVVEAFAVSDNRISFVGTNKLVRRLVGPATHVIDAKGRLVLPGFNDAHVHFMGIGNSFSTIDLRDATTPEQVTAKIERYARFLPRGRWILGSGLSAKAVPDIAEVNQITAENAVFIYLAGGDLAFANSLAMESGKLQGDAVINQNDPNGIVRGDTLRKIARAVPLDHTRNWSEIAETASDYAASFGVTSVQDMHSDDNREIYRDLLLRGKLKTRIYDCISLTDWKKLVGQQVKETRGEMIRGGCLKSFSDGGPEDDSKLLRDVLAADKAGLQVMVHAIGNSANDIVLSVFEQVTRSNPRRDRRFRVEHAHNPRPEDLARFSRANVVASMQPYLFSGGKGGYYSSLLKLNTRLAFGSDAAITDLNPMLGIHAAVNAALESVSIFDAVRAYTVGSAYAEFQEKEKGTIEVGKLADFVILSDDVFTIEPTRIGQIDVVMTVVDGRIVYQSS